MTPKERVLATFEGEPTDKVPVHHVGFSSKAAQMILGREAYVGFGIQRWREARALWEGEEAHRRFLERSLRDAYELAEATDQDILRLQYWRLKERPTRKVDDYTFFYGDPEGAWRLMKFHPSFELYGVVDQHPKERTTFESIKETVFEMEEMLDEAPSTPDISEERNLIETFGDRYAVRVHGGFLQVPLKSTWLAAVVAKPNLIARYLDVQTELALRRIRALADAGAKFIFGGGDMAGNDGPFYSPKAFRELMVPRLRIIAEECHKYGMYYLFASDGNLWPIADDLFGRTGVDGYYEIDRRAGMDLAKLRRRFPELVLVGNISSHTLSEGTREEVIRETLSCLREAKRSRGIIVGVSNCVLPSTPEENVKAMIETIRRNR
ncbi:MAG: hypothetical protein AYL32_003590 [Candidatus Bathyarchaeota archaeon B26-2]|nr:MAG: hypothetical protein AYL32_003590 [Candidatus Bathyarchaeota archaeon B26-2]